MATIKRFEDLEIWKAARILCQKIHVITSEGKFTTDFSLKRQILGSSGSVMDNIAEGFERDGKKEFLYFLYVAKGSLGEVRSQVYRALDSGYIDEKQSQDLIKECVGLSCKIHYFIQYLKTSIYEGLKKTP